MKVFQWKEASSLNGRKNLANFSESITGPVRSTTEQQKTMKQIESQLSKNAVSFGFLARQALLIVYPLTLTKLLRIAEDQGEGIKKPTSGKNQKTIMHFSQHLQFCCPQREYGNCQIFPYLWPH